MALEDITNLLLQNLLQSNQERRDPFSPPQSAREPAEPDTEDETTQQARDSLLPGFQGLLKQAGIDLDDQHAETVMHMVMNAGAAGGQARDEFGAALSQAKQQALGGGEGLSAPSMPGGGMDLAALLQPQGEAPVNPQLRQALAYQALLAAPKYNKLGSQAISAMMPWMAPKMLGPYLEQQQAQAQRATMLKNAIDLQKTREMGAKRQLEMQKLEAEIAYKKEQIKNVGEGKNKLQFRVAGNTMFVLDPKTGETVRTEQVPEKPGDLFKVKAGAATYIWDSPAAFRAGLQPKVYEDLPAGSSSERQRIAELETNIDKAEKYLIDNFDERFVGPYVGQWMEDFKTANGGLASYAAKAKLRTAFPDEATLEKALEYYENLEQLRTDITFYYSKSQVPKHEDDMRKRHIPLATNDPMIFKPSLKQTIGHMKRAKQALESQRRLPSSTGEAPPPQGSGFLGAPQSTNQGQPTDMKKLDEWLDSQGVP